MLALSASALSGAAANAASPDFPSKAVTIVVPWPPGGSPDILSRVIGEKLAQRLGQPVVVENRPGGSGTIGAAHVARSAPDGYTLMMMPSTFALSPLVLPKSVVTYDVQTDFAPVILASEVSLVLAANPGLGIKTVADLVRYAKQRPGVTYTGSSNGSTMHVAGEMLKQAAGINMSFIPYKGLAPAIADTLGGHVNLVISPYGTLRPHFASGALVPLGVLDEKSLATAPNILPVAKQGYPTVVVKSWTGLFAPRGTPRPVVEKLNREINAILKLPDVKEKIEESGDQIIVGGAPEALGETVKRDTETYAPIVRSAKITAD